MPAEGVSEEELLFYAASLEQKSEHPLAFAVLKYAEKQQLKTKDVSEFAAVAGNGLGGMLQGERLWGGNASFIGKKISIPKNSQKEAEALSDQGKTPLFFAKENKYLGMIAVADVLKEESPQAVAELKNMGIRVVLLTGDNERTAKAIGSLAEIDEVIAGVLPEGKDRVIRTLKSQGKVAMVGDGINDAPALTRADIGIDAADVVLMKSKLADVPAAIRLSRAALKNIHENLFWAFIYNIIGIPLAAGIWIPLFGLKLNPMFGAAAMSLSSFCVVTNALRLNLLSIYDTSKDKKIKRKKKLEGKTMEKTMKIEGMMCGHCEARVKKTLEAIEGVAEAKVSHEEGVAVVSLNSEVADDVLKKAVEDQDYNVLSIG